MDIELNSMDIELNSMEIELDPNWILGFVDGEGCFSFSLIKNDSLRFKYQIQGEFTVVQHQRDIQLLHALKKYFNCGSVGRNHGNRMHYRVKNLDHFLTIIIPFFEKHQLKTVKRLQLPVFKEICLCLKAKQHFNEIGFNDIKTLVKDLSNLKK
jgi:hypothetical protein